MCSRPHRLSRDLERVESALSHDFSKLDMSSSSLSEPRGRDPRPLRATASTPALGQMRTRSRSRESLYAGKQSHRRRSPDLRAKPGRPAIRFPPNFEFVQNSYTPSLSALELASSSSQPTARSSAENLVEPSSVPGSPPSSPRPLEAAPTQARGDAPPPKRHPASVLAKVSRPKSPNQLGATLVSPIDEEGDVPNTPTTPKQTAFHPVPRQSASSSPTSRPQPEAEGASSSPGMRGHDAFPPSDGPEPGRSPGLVPLDVERATDRAQEREKEIEGGRGFFRRWRRRSSSEERQKEEESSPNGGTSVLRRASTLLHHGAHDNSKEDEAALEQEQENLSRHWKKSVGFDTMPDALDTASESFSFTLQAKTKGYQRSKNTRIFMCAVDNNFYSETALAWCMEQLVEDGDELVAVRVVEGEKEELDQDLIREHAQDLLDQIAEMNDEVPGRKISIVVEFVHGRGPTSTLLRVIQVYRPNSLTVGTRGKSANTLQKLLGGAPMIGHVSRDILQRSPVPVVVVRPEAKVRKHLNKRIKNPSRRAYRNLVSNGPETSDPPLSAGHSGSLVRTSTSQTRS